VLFQKANKIRVLRQHDGVRVSGRLKDRGVGRITELEVADSHGGHTQRFSEPRRESWGKLGVEPDRHAATIG
jgi:hypothetical protein